MVLPGIASHSPRYQSFTSNGWAISPGLSCWIGVRTTSFSTAQDLGRDLRERLGDGLEDLPVRLRLPGRVHGRESGWMKGCMSEVLRSFFSYQVAVGRTMSE
jgi:hypothetical protein